MACTCPNCGHQFTPPKSKGSRLDPDWWPSKDEWEYAEKKGLTENEVSTEVEKFINYWTAKAGKDAAKRSWTATWHNWVINASERKGKSYGVQATKQQIYR